MYTCVGSRNTHLFTKINIYSMRYGLPQVPNVDRTSKIRFCLYLRQYLCHTCHTDVFMMVMSRGVDTNKLIGVDVSTCRDMHQNVHYTSFLLVKYVFTCIYVNICAKSSIRMFL